MVKLVVSDLDGTLLNAEHKISERTKQTVQALVAQGIDFMIATGRHYQDVFRLAQQLEVAVSLITSNGARVHNHLGELLYESHMQAAHVAEVLRLSAPFAVHRNLYQGDAWWVEKPHEELLAIHDASGFRYQLTDFTTLPLEGVDKLYFAADHETLLGLEAVLLDALADDLHITFTSPEYLEVMNKGVSKGNALSLLLQQKGIAAQEVMALGDGMNDKEMLTLVGHKVVMQNASERVKALFPEGVIAPSNCQDGVALHLEQFVLKSG